MAVNHYDAPHQTNADPQSGERFNPYALGSSKALTHRVHSKKPQAKTRIPHGDRS